MNTIHSPHLAGMEFAQRNALYQFDDSDHSEVSVENEGPVNTKKSPALARRETRNVKVIRIITVLVLVAAAVSVSYAAYFYASETEEKTFHNQFNHHGGKVREQFTTNARSRISVLQKLAESISLHAEQANTSFPFVTVPNLEERTHSILELAQVIGCAILPVVREGQRAQWEEYVTQERSWLNRELDWQEGIAAIEAQYEEKEDVFGEVAEWIDAGGKADAVGAEISSSIFTLSENGQSIRDSGPGPYTPSWQIIPVLPIPSIYNYNLMSEPGNDKFFEAVISEKKIALSSALDLSDESDAFTSARRKKTQLILDRWRDGSNSYDEGPFVHLAMPIFNRLEGVNSPNRVGALLMGFLYWQPYFAGILPNGTPGIIIVLRNTCGQAYTYRVEGESVSYVGDGDLHNEVYDDMVLETKWANFTGSATSNQTDGRACDYRISVYPSNDFQDEFVTFDPIMFALILSSVFVFTSIVFLVYDCLVQRRHHVVKDTAVKSNAVVTSLFPDEVRGRLDAVFQRQKSIDFDEEDETDGLRMGDSMPIADLYPNCTVLFADIVGFTSWSSSRSPTDVFRLLEALYGAFDRLARKHQVFKIETIGDCYVAVTGLPQPQAKHAIIMCRFAEACINQMHELLPRLCQVLGPDTSNLSMRFGLHSGPVTGGVMRGEKARFQLFGDTVNTAARMESNGQRGRLHVSQETADQLIKYGKSSWLSQRHDKINAKGKGKLITFWVAVMKGSSGQGTDITETAVEESEESIVVVPVPAPVLPPRRPSLRKMESGISV